MSGPRPDASGAVIAGGASRRLGQDKRLVSIEGRTLIARTVTTVRPLVDDLHVVVATDADRELLRGLFATAAAPSPDGPGARDASIPAIAIGLDLRPGEGPAAGLESALAAARHDLVLVVATDHPWLSPSVLGLLLERARTTSAEAVALAGPHGPEPLLAVYRRCALGTVRARLDAGVRRLQDVLNALDPMVIPAPEWRALDPEGRILDDVDRPEDLRRLGSPAAPRPGRSDEPSAGT
jgi:molybdenum cofactor guanylyltransferase